MCYVICCLCIYRIEEIPVDELNLEEDEMLIPVAHFQKDVYTTFGIPFLLKIKNVSMLIIASLSFLNTLVVSTKDGPIRLQKQPFSEVRERIFQKLGVTEKEFEKVSFVTAYNLRFALRNAVSIL